MSAVALHHKYVTTACWENALYVADNLRQEDKEELETSGQTAKEEIIQSMCDSHIHAYTISSPSTGAPMGLFGIADTGVVWLVSTAELPEYFIRFLKDSRKWIQEFHVTHPVLWNWVDARQKLHIKWLTKWLGFVITHEGFRNGYKFYRLEHRR